MAIMTPTAALKRFFDLLKSANECHEIYHIRHRNGDAVLMSQDEYESNQETLELLSTPEFREDFQVARREAESGDTLSFGEVFGEEQ